MILITILLYCIVCRSCSTDEDCSLGGTCTSGSCKCSSNWKGTSCSELNVGVTYKSGGYHVPLHYSWGGSVINDGTGTYHMFASEFINECGLMSWETNSQVIHATSSKPQGPFVVKNIALPTEHHNPTIRRAVDGTYLLFCIGENYDKPTNCNGTGEQIPERNPGPFVGGGIINLAYSKSLDGPWEQLDQNNMIHGRSGKWDDMVTNPAPVILANGTVLLYYRGSSTQGGTKIYQIGLASAPNWKGPYTRVVDTSLFTVSNEDPFVWQETDGHFHMLTHYFAGGGGHAFSADGVHWKFAGVGYNQSVVWDDHTTTKFGRRERPQVLIENGKPIMLFNGVTPEGSNNSFTIVTEIL